MEELYKAIEEKIKSSGYKGSVNGKDIYWEICDEIEEKKKMGVIYLCQRKKMMYSLNIK